MYTKLTNPVAIQVSVIGTTLKMVIVSKSFEGMSVRQRIEFLKTPFFQSELSTKYLASFEAYTPKEANDGGFGSGDFEDKSSTSSGSDKAAAKPAEI